MIHCLCLECFVLQIIWLEDVLAVVIVAFDGFTTCGKREETSRENQVKRYLLRYSNPKEIWISLEFASESSLMIILYWLTFRVLIKICLTNKAQYKINHSRFFKMHSFNKRSTESESNQTRTPATIVGPPISFYSMLHYSQC